ncbi:MAG: SlyX family protein [Xanthomonadales bacterium]|nr:SlyX family protein [Xanthomonadales bacterium]
MSDALELRLTELEIKLTFMDETVRALAEADADQSRRIVALESLLRAARNELAALRQSQADDPRLEPPPPHY